MSRYVVILVAIALAVVGAWWLIQLLALGVHPHAVQLHGWRQARAADACWPVALSAGC